MTRERSFRALSEVAKMATGANVPVNISLSCSSGWRMDGGTPRRDARAARSAAARRASRLAAEAQAMLEDMRSRVPRV
jgi:hypothetical protein